MCFSAEASYTGGVLLSAVGVATLGKAKKPARILFAAIPLLFGIQQFAEGILWTTLKSGRSEQLQDTAVNIFLITALVIWPVMIPLSVLFMEEVKKKRQILMGLLAIGGILAVYYAVCLASYNVTPQIQSFHIQYLDEFPVSLSKVAFVMYLISTIAPLFVSSVKRMWLFGALITVSCLITGILFAQYLTSVWCFFAALLSIVIFWILSGFPGKTGLVQTSGDNPAAR